MTSHFYVSTVLQERQQDGSVREIETRMGDYPTREIAEQERDAEEAMWTAFFATNPHQRDQQSVLIRAVEGFFGYPDRSGTDAPGIPNA